MDARRGTIKPKTMEANHQGVSTCVLKTWADNANHGAACIADLQRDRFYACIRRFHRAAIIVLNKIFFDIVGVSYLTLTGQFFYLSRLGVQA